MTDEEIVVRLTDHENEIGSLKHRVKGVEESSRAINRLTTAIEVMSTKQDSTGASVDRLTEKVETLEGKPAKRWEDLVDKLLFAVAGAFIAWVISGAPGV